MSQAIKLNNSKPALQLDEYNQIVLSKSNGRAIGVILNERGIFYGNFTMGNDYDAYNLMLGSAFMGRNLKPFKRYEISKNGVKSEKSTTQTMVQGGAGHLIFGVEGLATYFCFRLKKDYCPDISYIEEKIGFKFSPDIGARVVKFIKGISNTLELK